MDPPPPIKPRIKPTSEPEAIASTSEAPIPMAWSQQKGEAFRSAIIIWKCRLSQRARGARAGLGAAGS
jgi:hypothetical protein